MSAGRVVQVVRSDAFAGVERYITDVSTELHHRGWAVTVIGGNAGKMRAELPGGVEHRRGDTVVEVTRALWSVRRPDVVHAHMTAAELAAVLLRQRHRGRVIATRHFAAPQARSWPGRLARRVVAPRVDTQIAISRFVAEAATEPSLVIPNGVRPRLGPPADRQRTVLVLARLNPEKDTATALRAWAAAGLAESDWRLVVHGRGTQESALRALSAELGVADSVHFAGFVDDPRTELARAGMLLAAAPAEPFGLAVVEAMAEGTPVVAADGGAHPETLGEDGRFFPPGDADACARELVRLAADPALRADLGVRLQTRHQARFSLATHVDRLEEVYRS